MTEDEVDLLVLLRELDFSGIAITRSGRPRGWRSCSVREAVARERGEEPAPASAVPTDAAARPVDPSGRPTVPATSGAPEATAAGRHAAQTLVTVTVHDHLRDELKQLERAVGEVLGGRDNPAVARSLLNAMTMRQNYWSLGAFCASYCRVVTNHHLLEDEVMFRKLRLAQDGLSPVLARLEEEHELIAGLITRLDGALVAMVEDPSQLEKVRTVLEELAECLLSHLDYEEEQLLGPIARYNIVV